MSVLHNASWRRCDNGLKQHRPNTVLTFKDPYEYWQDRELEMRGARSCFWAGTPANRNVYVLRENILESRETRGARPRIWMETSPDLQSDGISS
jgi:hypothetical protein